MSTKAHLVTDVATIETIIADSATTSSEIDLGGKTLVGITFPAGIDGTALTFTVSPTSGGTFVGLITTAGAAVSYTYAASKYMAIDSALFNGVRYLKLVSGTSQTGASTITLHVKSKA